MGKGHWKVATWLALSAGEHFGFQDSIIGTATHGKALPYLPPSKPQADLGTRDGSKA